LSFVKIEEMSMKR